MQSSVYDIVYDDLKGVDFSEDASLVSPHRFPYLENMYRDYGGATNAGVETIPGFRSLYGFGGRIHGLFESPERERALLVHAGSSLFRVPLKERDTLSSLAPCRDPAGAPFTLANEKSAALSYNGRLLLLDGGRYAFYEGGALAAAHDRAYIPTLYRNEEPYEQKNLLTRQFTEEYDLFDLSAYRYGTDSLTYRIRYDGLCYVSGITGEDEVVVVPPRVTLGKREYAVAGIECDAFRDNAHIRELIVSEGVVELDYRALAHMQALECVVLPDTVTVIKSQCLAYCPKLRDLYVTRKLLIVEDHAFDGSPLANVYYGGSFVDFHAIEGAATLYDVVDPRERVLHTETLYRKLRLLFSFSEKTEALLGVRLGEEEIPEAEGTLSYRPLYEKEGEETLVSGILLLADEETLLYGKTLSLSGRFRDGFAEQIRPTHPAYQGSGQEAIERCRLLCLFADRVFLSGNPDLPGTVFYSQRTKSGENDPFYFGSLNYFTDGNGVLPITAMTASASTLFVFSEGGMGEAGVFCHVREETGNDMVSLIFPVAEGGFHVGCLGAAATFLDDTVFLSERGLDAVESPTLAGERAIGHRSSAVDRRLLAEDLSRAALFRFGPYLGIGIDGRVYLCDGNQPCTRQGGREYEWYYLSDIGVYIGQTDRYHTLSVLPQSLVGRTVTVGGQSLPLSLTEGEEPIEGETVYSAQSDDGAVTVYYVRRLEKIFPVDCHGEKSGGVFSPATVFCEADGLLFFGTADGTLLLFNTDKRESDGLIPRRYYSFNGRAYFSGCATKSENGGRPNQQKSTVKGYGAVKLKAMTGGRIGVRVRTEREDWQDCDTLYGGRLDFSETDFAVAEFSSLPETVVPLREKKKRWVEKQLLFFSEEYTRPFGLFSITYRYRVAGRIKS